MTCRYPPWENKLDFNGSAPQGKQVTPPTNLPSISLTLNTISKVLACISSSSFRIKCPSMSLNLYRPPDKVISILPCASAPEGCKVHHIGRNRPCLSSKPASNTESRSTLTKLFGILSYARQNRNSRKCHLFALPVELLQDIAAYLAPSDLIAFTLACKGLYSTLGSEYFSSLKKQKEDELVNLLALLQRDLPKYRMCRSCRILHSPRYSTVTLPPNVLHRPSEPDRIFQQTAIYLLDLGTGKKEERNVLYWLSHDHVEQVIATRICLSTISCAGVRSYSEPFPVTRMNFEYKILPVISRQNLIWHAAYAVTFEGVSNLSMVQGFVQDSIKKLDIRCCLHCSTGTMESAINSFLVTGEYAQHGGLHQHTCDCATEYQLGRVRKDGKLIGFTVKVWQWLGHRSRDPILKQKGMLQNLYEEANLDLSLGGYDVCVEELTAKRH